MKNSGPQLLSFGIKWYVHCFEIELNDKALSLLCNGARVVLKQYRPCDHIKQSPQCSQLIGK